MKFCMLLIVLFLVAPEKSYVLQLSKSNEIYRVRSKLLKDRGNTFPEEIDVLTRKRAELAIEKIDLACGLTTSQSRRILDVMLECQRANCKKVLACDPNSISNSELEALNQLIQIPYEDPPKKVVDVVELVLSFRQKQALSERIFRYSNFSIRELSSEQTEYLVNYIGTKSRENGRVIWQSQHASLLLDIPEFAQREFIGRRGINILRKRLGTTSVEEQPTGDNIECK